MGTPLYDRGVWLAMRALTVGHRLVDHATGGRVGRRLGPGVPTVWLSTTGRRTGRGRRTPLVAARDGSGPEAAYVVAGSGGGREQAPAWTHNLRAHAEGRTPVQLQVGDQHLLADVEELTGPERDRCYALMVRLARPFAAYERHATRTIPVFRLTPRAWSP